MAKKRTAGSGAQAAKPKATRGPSLRAQGWIMKVKTGYWVKPSAKGRKRAAAAIKSRKGKKHSAATKKKIRLAMQRVWKTGKTQSGRKSLLAKKGKKPGITQAAVMDKGRRKHNASLATLREAKKATRGAKSSSAKKGGRGKSSAKKKGRGSSKPDVPR